MNTNLQSESATWQARVVRRCQLADGVIGLTLTTADGTTLDYQPGAHLALHLNAGVRQYSLYNGVLFDNSEDDAEPVYRIAVRLEPDGRGGSREVVEQVEVGQLLRVSGPFNHFALQLGDDPVLLIAGGIGITPMLAMAQQCWQQQRPFQLHYVGSSLANMALVEAMMESPLASYCHLYAPELATRRPDIDQLVQSCCDLQIYVCGPERLIDAVIEAAEWHQLGAGQVRYERFGAALPQPQDGDAAFDVILASTGARIRVSESETITAALVREGVEISVSCGSGVCGSCKTAVLAGQPDHRDYFLDDNDQQHYIMPCCSRSQTAELILDC